MSRNNINTRRELAPVLACKHPVTGELRTITNSWRPSISVANVKRVEAFSDRLEAQLIDHIERFANKMIVVGCIAWLSNPYIIQALRQNASAVLLLVNDENYATWGNGKTHELYAALPRITEAPARLFAHLENTPMHGVHEVNYAPVRCIRGTGDALMHSKYLVFFAPKNANDSRPIPASVWTGSMNYTLKAKRNQENAVFIEDERLARFYFDDFVNSWMQSESLRIVDDPSKLAAAATDPNQDNPMSSQPPPSYTAEQRRLYAIRKSIIERRAKQIVSGPPKRKKKTTTVAAATLKPNKKRKK